VELHPASAGDSVVTPPGVPPPVEARLLEPFKGLLVFDVNQPVYVAIFDVRPYMAMELLFPGPNDDGLVSGGVHGVATFTLTQANEERQALFTLRAGSGEEYLYLVASRLACGRFWWPHRHVRRGWSGSTGGGSAGGWTGGGLAGGGWTGGGVSSGGGEVRGGRP
jgi:uncharacterized membrane protein YgcG